MTTHNDLTSLPNIGAVLASQLYRIGIDTEQDLIEMGTEEAITRISRIKDSGVCINMCYAIEGAIKGIRWHHLDPQRKLALKEYYNTFIDNKIR